MWSLAAKGLLEFKHGFHFFARVADVDTVAQHILYDKSDSGNTSNFMETRLDEGISCWNAAKTPQVCKRFKQKMELSDSEK